MIDSNHINLIKFHSILQIKLKNKLQFLKQIIQNQIFFAWLYRPHQNISRSININFFFFFAIFSCIRLKSIIERLKGFNKLKDRNLCIKLHNSERKRKFKIYTADKILVHKDRTLCTLFLNTCTP